MKDKGRPFGVTQGGEARNRGTLRWLRTVVVNDAEKVHEVRQAGIRKTCQKRFGRGLRTPQRPVQPKCESGPPEWKWRFPTMKPVPSIA